MRFILLALAVSCGGPSVEWAGKWRQPVGLPAGTYVECTLDGSKTSINGSGVQHREAGSDTRFTVSGTPGDNTCIAPGFCPNLTFTYDGGTTEAFYFAQPDSNHITLTNPQRALDLVRE